MLKQKEQLDKLKEEKRGERQRATHIIRKKIDEESILEAEKISKFWALRLGCNYLDLLKEARVI